MIEQGGVTVAPLSSDAAEIDTIARWRYDAFLQSYGLTLDDSRAQLLRLVDPPPGEAALVARRDGKPAGVCMLVRDELDAPHDLSPWLASLFVIPPLRSKGIGRKLVAAIEGAARAHGYKAVHLYTDSAESLYRICGWSVTERFSWDGVPAVLMSKAL